MNAFNITPFVKRFFLVTALGSLVVFSANAQTKPGSTPTESKITDANGISGSGITSPGKNNPTSADGASTSNGLGSDNSLQAPTTNNINPDGNNTTLPPPLFLREVQDGTPLQVGSYEARMLTNGNVVMPAVILEFWRDDETMTFVFYTAQSYSERAANAREIYLKDRYKEVVDIDVSSTHQQATVTFKRNTENSIILDFFRQFHFDGYLFYQKGTGI